MIVKAVKSFSGVRFNMHAGEVREVNDTETVRELMRIGYLVNSELKETPGQTAPAQTEDMPEKAEGLNETKRGKSKRN